MRPILRLVCSTAILIALVAPAAGATSLPDAGGNPVANTESNGGPQANVANSLPDVQQLLGDPFSAPRPANVQPTGAPDDDLEAALSTMVGAPDAATAAAARQEAIDILEGNPIPGRPYSGLALLNWNAPSKVQTVPGGPNPNVTIRVVRFGQHAITDTSMLSFADPTQPYTITWLITELGTGMGGELAPASLLRDGTTNIGGQVDALVPLALRRMDLGTTVSGRFHPTGEMERSRLAVQRVVVSMPPAGMTEAVLDPDLRPDHRTLVTLRPATTERVARVRQQFRFDPAATDAANKASGIAALSDKAPEKQLWTDLQGLDPANLAAMQALASQDLPLVAAMRVRSALPAGVASDPGADVTVALANDQTYTTTNDLNLAPGAPLTVTIVNTDNFEHDLSALHLFGRTPIYGALDWGRFKYDSLDADLGGNTTLAAGATRTITLHPASDAFAVWVGDPNSGEQAGAVITLDRGPARQTIDVGGTDANPRPFSSPLHTAQDATGKMWIALAGVDEILRVTPGADLATADRLTVKLPGGDATAATGGVLAPHGIAVDARGIVWVTLTFGDAIARIDPSQVSDGTSNGVTLYQLAPCPQCRIPAPPDPALPLRLPIQIDATQDGDGNTVLWYSEEGANQIGALRVAPDGTELNKVDFPCLCSMPTGVSLDRAGNVWFTEAANNRIGKLTPGISRPFAVSTMSLSHYNIPSFAIVDAPDLGLIAAATSNPHSVAVDRQGMVWFSETETGKIGRLDPSQAKPNTKLGFCETQLPNNDFHGQPLPADIAIDRAGTLYWTDEYGDIVGSVRTGPTCADVVPGPSWRPIERQSLTDGIMADNAGNLWFTEASAAVVSRISGVTAGNPLPGPLPTITATTATGALAATGLDGMTSIDVAVKRGAAVVTSAAGVGLGAGGSIDLGPGGRAWDAAGAPALQAGDVVTFTPHGPNAPGAFSFTVPALTGAIGSDGSIAGRALMGNSAIAGPVHIKTTGGSGDPAVDVTDGTFSLALDPAQSPGTPATVMWAAATKAAVFRTVSPLTGPAGATAPGADGGTGTGTGAGGAGGGSSPAQVTDPRKGCPRSWLTRTSKGRSVFLLGAESKTVRTCLGKATSIRRARGAETWRYGRALTLTLRKGRVESFTLLDRTWRSAPDKAGVGSTEAALRRALGTITRNGRALRTVLTIDRRTVADVRVTLSGARRALATRIEVRSTAVARLDASGRALLRRAR
ncbi:MAG: virginiamycin lyase [Solirubrobacteraceae bacterium]|nr:virginiamycin lyase [Solirubrobacteraceae bacterium]